MSSAPSNTAPNGSNADSTGGGRVRQYEERTKEKAPPEAVGTFRRTFQSNFVSMFTGKPCVLKQEEPKQIAAAQKETVATSLQTHPKVQMHPLLQRNAMSPSNNSKNSLLNMLSKQHNEAVQRAMEEENTERGNSAEPEKAQASESVQKSNGIGVAPASPSVGEKLSLKTSVQKSDTEDQPSLSKSENAPAEQPEVQTNISPSGEADKDVQTKPQGPHRTRGDPNPVQVRSSSSEFGAVQMDGEESISQKFYVFRSPQSHSAPQTGTPALESDLKSSKGAGTPMSDTDRGFFESRMGADFSNVRIHTGSNAVQMNEGLGAKAFAHGSDIYFNSNQYQPGTSAGKHLLAHELTHTVQQGGSSVRKSESGEAESDSQSGIGEVQASPSVGQRLRLNPSVQKSDEETAAPKIQAKCDSCAAEEAVQKSEDETAAPKVQAKCNSCASSNSIPNISRTPHSNSALNFQPSLKIGTPGDKYEQEADATADKVMRMSDEQVAAKNADPSGSTPQAAEPEVSPQIQHASSKKIQRLFGLFGTTEDPCAEKKEEKGKEEEQAKDEETVAIERDCSQRNPPAEEAPDGTDEPDQDQGPTASEAREAAPADARQANAPCPHDLAPDTQQNPGEEAAKAEEGPCAGMMESAAAAAGPAAGGTPAEAAPETGQQAAPGPETENAPPGSEEKTGPEGGENEWLQTTAAAPPSPLINPGGKGEKASPELREERNLARAELGAATGQLGGIKESVSAFNPSAIKFLPADKTDPEAQQDEGPANAAAGGFMGFAQAQIHSLISKGETSAKELQSETNARKAALKATVRQRKARAQALFTQLSAKATVKNLISNLRITISHLLQTMRIKMGAMQARMQVNTAHTASMTDLRQKGRDALAALQRQYAAEAVRLRGIGTSKASKAKSMAGERARAYRNGEGLSGDMKERVTKKKKDGFWDGYLTYNRYKARAEAAEETGKQYAEGFEKEANKNADAVHCGMGKDIEFIEAAVIQGETNLKCVLDQSLEGINAHETAALDAADNAKTEAQTTLSTSLQATQKQLKEKKATQFQFLNDFGIRQEMGIERDASRAAAAILQQTAEGASAKFGMLQAFAGSVTDNKAPPAELLQDMIGGFSSGFQSQADGAKQGLDAATSLGRTGINAAFQTANSALRTFSDTGLQEMQELGAAFIETADTLTQNTTTGLAELATSVGTQLTTAVEQTKTAFEGVVTGVQGLFDNVRNNTQANFDASAGKMEEGFQAKLDNELKFKICTEAEKAAAEVQPWWKSVLKILLVILVVVVVALVIGPAVIAAVGGALTALAGSLGASAALAGTIGAWLGPIIGGAIVGAFAGAVIQLGNNIIDGKNLLHGMKQAIIAGAIGGALGGFGGQFAQVLVRGGGIMASVGRFGIEMAFDAVGNILGDVANGVEFNLQSFLTNMAIGAGISIGMRGFSRYTSGSRTKVQEIRANGGSPSRFQRAGAWMDSVQMRMSAAGEGLGARAGSIGPRGPDVQTTRTNLAEANQRIQNGEMFPVKEKETGGGRNTGPEGQGGEVKTGTTEGDVSSTAPQSRSTHTDSPEIEPGTGIVSKLTTDDGHTIKVINDGKIIVCSTCGELRVKYADEVANNPHLRQQLDTIEAIPNPHQKALAAKNLRNQLELARTARTTADIRKGNALANAAGLPNSPNGYHWRNVDGSLTLVRNAGVEGFTLHYDPDLNIAGLPRGFGISDSNFTAAQKVIINSRGQVALDFLGTYGPKGLEVLQAIDIRLPGSQFNDLLTKVNSGEITNFQGWIDFNYQKGLGQMADAALELREAIRLSNENSGSSVMVAKDQLAPRRPSGGLTKDVDLEMSNSLGNIEGSYELSTMSNPLAKADDLLDGTTGIGHVTEKIKSRINDNIAHGIPTIQKPHAIIEVEVATGTISAGGGTITSYPNGVRELVTSNGLKNPGRGWPQDVFNDFISPTYNRSNIYSNPDYNLINGITIVNKSGTVLAEYVNNSGTWIRIR